MMNSIQWQLRHLGCQPKELECYLQTCEPLSREEFYAPGDPGAWQIYENHVAGSSPWESPWVETFAENQTFHADLFWVGGKPNAAPTVILLHALMSAHAGGYRRIAADFNRRGWNVAFPHLPYHYRRRVPKFPQGALCITANLIRNGETLRQAVIEIRTLMALLRNRGVREFALVGTSFGGWTGALVSFLEPDLRFLALLQPIADVEHAIWENPVSVQLRRVLQERGISREATPRHAHLSSPLHGQPQLLPERILLCGGQFDAVSPVRSLEKLARRWGDPAMEIVPQGHFGYQAMRTTLAYIRQNWLTS